MRSLVLLMLFAAVARAYMVPTFSRQWIMRTLFSKFLDGALNTVPGVLGSVQGTLAKPNGMDALVVSCGPAGRAVCERLKRDGYHITIVTTKPSRVPSLVQLGHRVFTIPQIETQRDEVLEQCVRDADLIVIADAVGIFSAHTYVRTCARVGKLVERNAWGGTLALVSSENVYGCPRQGEVIDESSSIYATSYQRNGWHINSNVLALQIRTAENYVFHSTPRSFALRTCGLWDEAKFFEVAKRNSGAELPLSVQSSFMSFTTTNLVAEAVAQGVARGFSGTYNVANMGPMTRRMFLGSLHAVYGMKGPAWVERDLDPDSLFSIDAEPLLPASQRSNMRLSCDRFRKAMA